MVLAESTLATFTRDDVPAMAQATLDWFLRSSYITPNEGNQNVSQYLWYMLSKNFEVPELWNNVEEETKILFFVVCSVMIMKLEKVLNKIGKPYKSVTSWDRVLTATLAT